MDSLPVEIKQKAALYAYYFRQYLAVPSDMATAFGEFYADSLHLPHAKEVALRIEKELKDYSVGYKNGYQEAINVERLAHLNTLYRLIAYRYQVPEGYHSPQLEKLDIDAIKRLIDAAFDEKTLTGFEKVVREQVVPIEVLVESI